MKTRILSIILVMLLILPALPALPAAAFAENGVEADAQSVEENVRIEPGTSEISGVVHPESQPKQQTMTHNGQKYTVLVKSPIGKDYGFYYDDYCYQKGFSFYADHTAETGENEKLKWKDCYDKNYGDICTYVYTEYEGETEQFIRGDVNRDGKVNAVDLSLLKHALLGSDRTDIVRKAADWNGDKTLDIEDARGLLNFLLQVPETE